VNVRLRSKGGKENEMKKHCSPESTVLPNKACVHKDSHSPKDMFLKKGLFQIFWGIKDYAKNTITPKFTFSIYYGQPYIYSHRCGGAVFYLWCYFRYVHRYPWDYLYLSWSYVFDSRINVVRRWLSHRLAQNMSFLRAEYVFYIFLVKNINI